SFSAVIAIVSDLVVFVAQMGDQGVGCLVAGSLTPFGVPFDAGVECAVTGPTQRDQVVPLFIAEPVVSPVVEIAMPEAPVAPAHQTRRLLAGRLHPFGRPPL